MADAMKGSSGTKEQDKEKKEDVTTEIVDAAEKESAATTDESTELEPFDRARAMETIRKQREEVKAAKKVAQELERYKKAEEEKKLADMSETDRLKTELSRAQKELNQAVMRNLQIEAAGEVGLPVALATRLKGETLDELKEDAKAILDLLPKQKAAPNAGATNPGDRAGKEETLAAKKARLLGQAPDIWAGGGINWGEQPPKEK